MSPLDTATVADTEQILAVAQEVFAALIDDGEVLLMEAEPLGPVDDVVVAWVDMTRADSPFGIRTSVRAPREDAYAVVRALLRMAPGEEVTEDDLVDAFGEIANVVGGNLKSLLPEHAVLSLPTVATAPTMGDELIAQVGLAWRDSALTICLWTIS